MAARIRHQKNTLIQAVTNMRAAQDALPSPTEPLDSAEQSYFERAIRSRESAAWSEHDLAICTALAQAQAQYAASISVLKEEGRTTEGPRGNVVAHPEVAVMNALAGSIRAFSAQLGLTASQRGSGSSAVQRGRNQAEIAARSMLDRDDRDFSLLA